MEQKVNFFCKIYVDEDEIYSGDLSEIPEKFRNCITWDISEWADSLGKRGMNELLYSHLVWYEKKGLLCQDCSTKVENLDSSQCNNCGGKVREEYLYERNASIDKIMTCIGMISRIQVSK